MLYIFLNLNTSRIIDKADVCWGDGACIFSVKEKGWEPLA
jgi:hypothetical protein